MELNLELGQIFWLNIPLFSEKNWKYERPFLVYGVDDENYILLKISSSLKDYLDQFDFSLTSKPSSLYKKNNFVEPNILIYIEHNLFLYILNKTTLPVEQGQSILPKDFNEITKMVKGCFNNKKYQGNRYEVRIK